ncbi:cytochrome d ubiquinol oxidase subunit II [Trebonia kvetii]|uniref:Cytochrome d ubiquinol oxidase subunit II n=1 Tax=Trebonia kvetii TaxID=2480626 RepID=A0A6P2C3X2_9ACTN|nr:cytochrome d ubiquinol oxidase subunit II [Trebonia kvetii]TVZ04901.1 cytochrome d ubiquinol oxidase subunit II [Trebonia kvetii]
MHLSDLWFIAIAVLWSGYFVLEGFDFGVGILLPFLSRGDETAKRVMINTIGPVWDGNEVWLLTAGGATFAAFPAWYAAMFSAFYLPLLIILVALIIRGVAFEYRGKRDGGRWRRGWDACIFLGSLVPALLWGVAFGNIVRGIPLNAAEQFTGNFWTFLNPYAILGGVTTLALFTLHGALFLALKTTDDLRRRANATASAVAIVAIVAGAGFLAWTGASYRASTTSGTSIASVVLAALAAACLIGAALANRAGREGVAFAANAVAILTATASLFTALYPRVLPSTTSPAFSLTTANAASAAKTLAIMTVVACIFLPLVIAYQAWTYWVFRRRVIAPPASALRPSAQPPSAQSPSAPSAPGGW